MAEASGSHSDLYLMKSKKEQEFTLWKKMRNCSVVICDRFTTWFEWQFWYSGRRGENVMQRLSFSSNKSCDFYKSCKTCLKATQKMSHFPKCFLFTFGAMSTKGRRRGTAQHSAARTAQTSKQKPGDFLSGFQNTVIDQLLLVKKLPTHLQD